MPPRSSLDPKQLYARLRELTWQNLWENEVPKFNAASERERFEQVGLIRAVGVVFSESGPREKFGQVRAWLRTLLEDPQEKIRRYAMTALPKIGANQADEAQLLSLLSKTQADREKQHLARALNKIGGEATLQQLAQSDASLGKLTEQKVKASIARQQGSATVRLDTPLRDISGLRLHLHTRDGLERLLREEAEHAITTTRAPFRIVHVTRGLVVLAPTATFTLSQVYALRCFASLGIHLGAASGPDAASQLEAQAKVIASPLTRRLLQILTTGPARYRLNIVGRGHQRGAVRQLVTRAYELCPEVLNDSREAPWSIDVYTGPKGSSLELSPRLSPDPRFAYRLHDVPAASHPPLAACMARLAGKWDGEIVWDPFCGSGVELIERARLGGVRRLIGSDISAEACAAAEANLANPAAEIQGAHTQLANCDFRNIITLGHLRPGEITLIVSNPPMGRRVIIPNLRGIIESFFSIAHSVLKPGGRLVFANPVPAAQPPPGLRLETRQLIDMGGFECRLEKYVKLAARSEPPKPTARPKKP